MPTSKGREELAVLVALEVLTEAVAFDAHDLRKLPFSPSLITKVLKSLKETGVLERVNRRKYLFSDKFLGVVKEEVLRKTPRSGLMQFPAMTIFDMCGIEGWSEQEVKDFAWRLRQHWLNRSKTRPDKVKG